MKICTRADCSKKLRKDNKKGECSSNCQSPDAPPAARAKGVEGRGLGNPPRQATKADASREISREIISAGSGGPRAKLFQIALLLGLHPDAVIDELAQGWIDALREKLNEEA